MNHQILRRIAMTIKDRNLTAGMTLVGKYHKQAHKCQVVQGEGDKVRYRLEDGREFKSPSAAGMAITGHACDGWVFWSLETNLNANAPNMEAPNQEGTPATENANVQEVKEAAAETVAPIATVTTIITKSFHRTPNQRGVSEGKTRWYCQTCGESFMAPYGEIPQECPQGHKA
jgi:rubrerythrin